MEEKTEIRDFIGGIEQPDDTYIEKCPCGSYCDGYRMYPDGNPCLREISIMKCSVKMTNMKIQNEYELLRAMKEMSALQEEYA